MCLGPGQQLSLYSQRTEQLTVSEISARGSRPSRRMATCGGERGIIAGLADTSFPDLCPSPTGRPAKASLGRRISEADIASQPRLTDQLSSSLSSLARFLWKSAPTLLGFLPACRKRSSGWEGGGGGGRRQRTN